MRHRLIITDEHGNPFPCIEPPKFQPTPKDDSAALEEWFRLRRLPARTVGDDNPPTACLKAWAEGANAQADAIASQRPTDQRTASGTINT